MFRYLRMTITKQNYVHEEMNGILNSMLLATIEFRILCLLVYYLKVQRLK
jgi:hypothetical protein